uniref:Serine/threonine specific protein phosphatases domain-containing protein n=1 Tax=Panagrolaimus sp. JU765 TaxID=591449 RepID=A0AC34QP06_9BILA
MTSVSSIKSTATAVPSPSLSTCLSENYSQHEAKFTVKPAIKGLAKRIIHRLTVYRLLDGFTELELFEILDSMIELIEPAPAFVEMSAPVVIFGDTHGQFNDLMRMFSYEKLICMHGGISPDIKSLDTLYKLKKPRTHNECDMGIALDLMWSDPATGADACCAWQFNKMRNASWMFGNQSVKEFNAAINVDLVVRAHELCKFGHLFYCDKMLVTIFSAPNYCGTDGNCASCMKVGADLKISFVTLKPILDKSKLSMEKLAELEKQSKNVDVKSPNPSKTFLLVRF